MHPRSSQPTRVGQPRSLVITRAVLPIGVGADVYAHVAQSVEHLHGKEKVIGSIPIVGSTRFVLGRAAAGGACRMRSENIA